MFVKHEVYFYNLKVENTIKYNLYRSSAQGHPHLAILLAIVLLTHPQGASFRLHLRKLLEMHASTSINIVGNIASNIVGNVEHVELSSSIARNFQLF